MIRVECKSCNHDLEINDVRHFGTSDITLLLVPCGCSDVKSIELEELETTNEELHKEINLLEERYEELVGGYDLLEKESREMKWKAKHNQLWMKCEDLKEWGDRWEGKYTEEQRLHQKTIRTNIEVDNRRRAENNIKFDDLEVKFAELAIRHKKMVFEYDKLRAEHNGGAYERSVDL